MQLVGAAWKPHTGATASVWLSFTSEDTACAAKPFEITAGFLAVLEVGHDNIGTFREPTSSQLGLRCYREGKK